MKKFSDILNEWHYSGENVESIYKEFPKTREDLEKIVVERIKENPKQPYLLDIDTSKIDDMNRLFSNFRHDQNRKKYDVDLKDLEVLLLNTWDVSKVRTMDHMFYKCYNLRIVDISGWNTSNVNNISSMFSGCRNLEEIKGLNDLNLKNIIDGNFVFFRCEKLKRPSWYDTKSHVINYEDV